jgi:hypothetical protein
LRSFEIPNQSDKFSKLFSRVSLKGFCPAKTRRLIMCKIRWTVLLVMIGAIMALSGCQTGKSLLKTENEGPQLAVAALPNYTVGEYFTFDDGSSRMVAITYQDHFGMALGILPRLRLPLPEALGAVFKKFAFEHAGPKSNRYLYVKLSKSQQAVLGTKAPIQGIAILQRDSAAKPALMKVKRSTVVKDVIFRNFARQNPAMEIMDRLYSVAEKAACYTLKYASLDQAVELLDDTFGLQTP